MGPSLAEQHAAHVARRARMGMGVPQPEHSVPDERAILTEQFAPNWFVTPCGPSRPVNWVDAEPDFYKPLSNTLAISDISNCVAKEYGVTYFEMKAMRRAQSIVRPRQVAMYLSKVLTMKSYPQIGLAFGGRDHTTVLHAVRKIESLLPVDPELAVTVAYLEAQLSQ